MATPVRAVVVVVSLVKRRFASILEKVDFPADLGPHTSVVKGPLWANDTRSASFLFHAGGDESSWIMHFLGASSELHTWEVLAV
jgi:hypothetical protein